MQNIYRKVYLPIFEAKKQALKQKLAWYISIQKNWKMTKLAWQMKSSNSHSLIV